VSGFIRDKNLILLNKAWCAGVPECGAAQGSQVRRNGIVARPHLASFNLRESTALFKSYMYQRRLSDRRNLGISASLCFTKFARFDPPLLIKHQAHIKVAVCAQLLTESNTPNRAWCHQWRALADRHPRMKLLCGAELVAFDGQVGPVSMPRLTTALQAMFGDETNEL
jgi:hypothetical protein